MKKDPHQNKELKNIMTKDSPTENEDHLKVDKSREKGTINDTEALASQIMANNLIDKADLEGTSEKDKTIDFDGKLEQSEFGSMKSVEEPQADFEKGIVEFESGWTFTGGVHREDNVLDIQEEREGLLESPQAIQYHVKFSKMKGTRMGVFNDYVQQKVFFVNLDLKTVTPTG